MVRKGQASLTVRDEWFDLSIFCFINSKLFIRSFLVRTRNEPKKPPKGVPLGTPSAVRILRCERGVMSDKPRHLCDKTRSQRLCVWFGCCRGVVFDWKLSLLIKFYLDLFNCKVGKCGDIHIAFWTSFSNRRGRRPRRWQMVWSVDVLFALL